MGSADRPAQVLVIHDSFPLVDRSGADSRLVQVLLALREAGHFVTFVARTPHGRDPYAAILEDAGIRVFAYDVERLRWTAVDLPPHWNFGVLLGGKFDLAILSHWFWSGISVAEDYLDDIQRLSPGTLVAVLTDDYHGLRERRAAELSGLASDWERSYDFEQRELEVYRRADIVLSISDHDRVGLMAAAPGLEIELLPMAAHLATAGPGYSKRGGLLFLANFANPASSDGMTWFLQEVWPLVKGRLSNIALHLAGNNAPVALAVPGSGVVCQGHVPDLYPLFSQYRVFVSPIRFGTGIKTKNLAALAYGLPLVTTTIGAEGMYLRAGETALIADNPEDFAEAVIRIYTDADLWGALARNGRDHVRREFSMQRLRTRLGDLIARALTFRPHRTTVSRPLSFRRVETDYPEILSHQPSGERISLRIQGYLTLAEGLLLEGRPDIAREQLRHIFAFVKGPIPRTPIFARVDQVLDRCYKELEESKPYASPVAEPDLP